MPPKKVETQETQETQGTQETQETQGTQETQEVIINVKKITDKSLEFVVKNGHLEVMNSLRRVILAEVPTIAPKYDQYKVDDPLHNDVVIKENTGVLHDQIMGHRISLLPIHMDALAISNHKRDDYKFVFDSTNSTKVPIYITTADIVVYDRDSSPLNSQQRDMLLPPDPFTGDHPIVARLKPGEVFKAEFYGRKGIARENARWSSASTCAMMNVVDDETSQEKLKEKLEGQEDESKIREIREQHSMLDKYRYFKKDELGDPSEISFNIESECGMSAAEIVASAFDVLLDKISIMSTSMSISRELAEGFYELHLKDEDHTMGNLYQALCYRFYKSEIDYIGYYMPHPLERNIVVKIKVRQGLDLQEFLDKSREDIYDHVKNVKMLFSQATGLS